MQKTLLSLALNSSRETGVPQWVWEVQRSFQKITEILCGSISYELSSRHFLSSSASKNNCAVNRKTAEPPRVCSVTSRHFLSQASLGPVKLTQETRNREPTRSR